MREDRVSNETEELRRWVAELDPRHRALAQAYADQLALGEPAPSSAGLDRATVREIRRRLWNEWRRRIASMPGTRGAA